MGQRNTRPSVNRFEPKSGQAIDQDVAGVNVVPQVMGRYARKPSSRDHEFGRKLLGLVYPAPNRWLRNSQSVGHRLFAREFIADCHQGFVACHAAYIRLRIIGVNTETYGDGLFVSE